jgi:ribosomal protein S18 acetylase RimI-like enzyme
VIRYRPFLNTDVPHLVNVWRQQPRIRGLFSSVTVDLFDLLVLSKPYFDRQGLILALDEDTANKSPQPLGFVHAGFGPNASLSDVDQSQGLICQLKVLPGERSAEVARGLLTAALDYLKRSGSKIAFVGSHFPHAPFYLGLYGGSRMPGIMHDDRLAREALLDFGFHEQDQVILLERKLAGFRPLAGRNQTDIRRNYQVKAIPDPLETSWWECCLFSLTERDRFTLYDPKLRQTVSSVSFWDMQPMSSEYGAACRGLYDLHVQLDLRRSGLASFLIGESLKSLMQRGVSLVEVQVRASDQASRHLFQKLQFTHAATAIQMMLPIE